MGFWRDISPIRASKEFAGVWQSENPYRWRVLAVSIAMTAGLMIILIPKSERIEPRRPDITYISTFADGRTDAEIEASNIANQKRKEELAALQQERDEFRKELWRTLGKATLVDTDAMERQIAADKAAEEARQQAADSAVAANAGSGSEGAAVDQ